VTTKSLIAVLLGFLCCSVALGIRAVSHRTHETLELAIGEAAEVAGDTLVLMSLDIPRYPSGNPRQYESGVLLISEGQTTPVTISVNHPLRHKGWWISQTSCNPAANATLLTISRDPCLPLAAVGGLLLLLGSLGVCVFGRSIPVVSEKKRKSAWSWMAGVLIVSVPLFIILRAVLRPEPVPALQSPLMAPHVAAYAASYVIMIFAACGIGKRLVPLGYFLMTLGLVLGALWGKICWGDWWQYDPKEMFSLATWLVYGAYFVWRNCPIAERFLRVLGAVLVILTATWVNFAKIFAGLHSYS